MSQVVQRVLNLLAFLQSKPWIGIVALLFFWMSLILFPTKGLSAPVLVKPIKDDFRKEIQKTIRTRYPDAQIEILSALPKVSFKVVRLQWIAEPVPGQVQLKFIAERNTRSILANVKFNAWRKIPVALRRIYPKEELRAELFEMQNVDVSKGNFRDQQAWLLSPDVDFSRLEARVSILEGQSPLKSSVQWIPLVKQGQWISVELTSGALSLTTLALAQEPGQAGQQIRIITRDTKKELIGSVTPSGKVHVKL